MCWGMGFPVPITAVGVKGEVWTMLLSPQWTEAPCLHCGRGWKPSPMTVASHEVTSQILEGQWDHWRNLFIGGGGMSLLGTPSPLKSYRTEQGKVPNPQMEEFLRYWLCPNP